MTKLDQDFEMYQGEEKAITVPVVDSNGDPLNMTGATIYYGVFTSKSNTTAVIEKTYGSGITLVNSAGTADAVRIALDKLDTNDLLPSRYYHECRVTLNGDPAVVFEGRLRLKRSITAPSS